MNFRNTDKINLWCLYQHIMFKSFLVVPPGIEQIAIQELKRLFPHLQPTSDPSGLEFECDLETIYRLNLLLRVPNRILVRFAEFEAYSFKDLFSTAVRLPWKQYLKKNSIIQIRTSCHKSKLYHSDAVTQRLHQAIEANLGGKITIAKKNDDEQPVNYQLIIARLNHDRLTISFDSSGSPLYMRGYREILTKAPIRENLAASIILASGWTPQFPLIDPFCGSGTIPIEAALMQNNIPPGYYRDFAFKKWPGYKEEIWQSIRHECLSKKELESLKIYGFDRDKGAIEVSRQNAEKARVDSLIEWGKQPISSLIPFEQPGWIITNPPYGIRISENKDIRNLYAQFGKILKNRFSGWEIVFLCSNKILANQTELNLKSLLSFSNGGIEVQAFYSKID